MPTPSERSIQKILEHRNKVEAESHSEEWYALEHSVKGANDWFAATGAYDTRESAQKCMAKRALLAFDWRIVKKTLITEVVP